MRQAPVVVLLLCVLVLGGTMGTAALPGDAAGRSAVGSGEGPATAGAGWGSASGSSDPDTVRELQQSFDRTEFRITVHANGSAEWTFRFKQTLANDTERAEFREFADRFDSEETTLYTDFKRRARALTDEGANATDRPMNATGFSKRASVNALGNQGTVEMSFHWVAFAPVSEEGTVVVGDVFQGGLYIRADQRLVVSTGTGVAFAEAAPEPDSVSGDSLAGSESITWEGERSFTDERPRIVLAPPPTATDPPGTSGTDGPEDGRDTPTPGRSATGSVGTSPAPGGGSGLLPIVGFGAALVLGLGAAFAYRSGVFDGTGTTAIDDGDDGNDESGGDADGASAESGTGTSGESVPPEPSVPDEELLSDEDRVMGLLDEQGGRMKQVEIVERTGWSKSKVSMLLSDMEDDGEISKLRVGRENIISKRGMEPEAAGSPFDDEDEDE
jgi:hypothetical protein